MYQGKSINEKKQLKINYIKNMKKMKYYMMRKGEKYNGISYYFNS